MIPQIVISLFSVLSVKIFEEHLFLPLPSAELPCSSTLPVVTGALGTVQVLVLVLIVRKLQLGSGGLQGQQWGGSGQGLSWTEAQGLRQGWEVPSGPVALPAAVSFPLPLGGLAVE